MHACRRIAHWYAEVQLGYHAGGVLPDVVQENVSHHFGSCYNGALGLVESAGVVFNVAHLPH